MKISNVHKKDVQFISKLNFQFLFIIFLLISISLVNFYSVTHTSTSSSSSVFWTHALWILLGTIVFFLTTALNYQFISRICYFLYGANVLALVLVLFFGASSHGAQRWFDLGFISFQPSETMKVVLIYVLSLLFSKTSTQQVYGFRQIAGAFFLTIIPMILIALQPDLGTSLIIGIQVCVLILFLKLSKRLFISFFSLILIAVPSIWVFSLKDYQKSRILTFISSQKDPKGAGYNIIQSKIAIGSGQLFGKGFRKGTQAQLKFLPERQTDFIFSVLSEEHGFFGSSIVLGLFLLLILNIVKIAKKSRNKLGVYLCIGCIALILCPVLINVGMTIGLFPVVGIPLPLLSYGGSNMITIFISLGLVSSVSAHRYIYS